VIAFTAGDRVVRAMTEGRSYQPYPALDAPGFARKITALLEMYHWEHTLVQMNLLDSHDTARLLTLAQDDLATVRLATLFQMTYPGAPSIFYGDEIGLRGALDPDSRRAMPWDESEWNSELLDYFKQVIQLRKDHAVLRHGQVETIYTRGSVYAMARTSDTETLLVALNVAEEPQQVTLPVGRCFPDDTALHSLFGPPVAGVVQQGEFALTLPAREGVVLGRT
jgi:glycosidase